MASSSEQSMPAKGFWPYLIPGMCGFVVVILVPFVMNLGLSFTTWKGLGVPKFAGFRNYTRLFTDDAFWSSLLHTLAFVMSMAVIPTALGVILAAVLFDYISQRFSEAWASFFRAGFYLPQILPVSAAGSCPLSRHRPAIDNDHFAVHEAVAVADHESGVFGQLTGFPQTAAGNPKVVHLQQALGQGMGQIGIENAGGDGIYVHAEGRGFAREAFGKADHRGFRGGVVHRSRKRADGADRGDV